MDPLVERARTGDRAAVEALLAQVAPAVHRFGLRMCRNPTDADDVLQDTLLAVARHIGDFEGRSSLSSWVFTLTRTACARRRRGLKNQPPVSDDRVSETAADTPDPEALLEGHELASVLRRALDGLPEDYREVILLRDMEGLSAIEAAAVVGLSVDALKSRLHRARSALRLALRPLLEQAAPPSPNCPDVATMFSRKLEGDLSPDDCSAMEQHLVGCPSCGAACDALKRALLACRHTSTAEVPPEVQAQVRAAVRAWTGVL